MAKDFNAREISDALDRALTFIVQETAKSVHRTVVLASPVGDPTLWQDPESAPPGYVGGTFRASWLVGVGSPPPDVAGAPDPGGADTLQKGRLVIETEVVSPGRSVYVVNNQPYAGPLNDGHSTQAPAGFVEQAIAAAVAGAIPGPTELP